MLRAARKEENDEMQPEVLNLQHTSHAFPEEVHSQLSTPRTTSHTVPVQA